MEVVVEYDYTAEERDELTLKQGDIVTNVSQFEEGWYIGTFNGKEGVFPDNFVRIIKPAPTQNNGAKQNDRLESQKERQVNPQLSTSPVGDNLRNHGGAMSPPGGGQTGGPGAAAMSTKASDHVKVAYAYNQEQADELELVVGEFLRVLSRDLPEEGWWRGTSLRTGKTGVFPNNFVKMADANDPDFKRALADYKAKFGSSSHRLPNGVPSNRVSQSAAPTSPTGNRRYDSSPNRTDPRRRNEMVEGSPGDKRMQSKIPSAAPTSSVSRGDGRSSSKPDSARSNGRAETSTPKTNGSYGLSRKGSVSRPDYDSSTTKIHSSKSRCSSLTRMDQNRGTVESPHNLNDLQSLIYDQRDRLSAMASQLENFEHIVESLRREQQEYADDVNGQLREINRQLASVKSAQANNQASVNRSIKNVTDRLRSLMLELDEVKKLHADDQVELSRLKKVILDIDSRTMMPSTAAINGSGESQMMDHSDLNVNHNNNGELYASSRSHGSAKPPAAPR